MQHKKLKIIEYLSRINVEYFGSCCARYCHKSTWIHFACVLKYNNKNVIINFDEYPSLGWTGHWTVSRNIIESIKERSTKNFINLRCQ